MDAPSAHNGQAIFPRILVFDRTALGDGSATGEINANLFAGWAVESYLQVYHISISKLGVSGTGKSSGEVSLDDIKIMIDDFAPDLIIYRPVPDTPELHEIAMSTIRLMNVPLVTWIMDDWPASLEIHNPSEAKMLVADFRWLLQYSTVRLSICDAMSVAMKNRYGVVFSAIANGVDPARWSPPAIRKSSPVRLRYAGSLAENMTLGTLLLIAGSVEKLAQSGTEIIFEIKSHPWWHGLAAKHFEQFSHTSIVTSVLPPDEYVEWLSTADALIIAYNFDPASRTYVKYSMANKLPECLASGVPLLAVGPKDIATMQYLDEIDCGIRVQEKDSDLVQVAIKTLVDSPPCRFDLAKRGQEIAFKRHNIHEIRDRFTKLIRDAASKARGAPAEFSHRDKGNLGKTAETARIQRIEKGDGYVTGDVDAKTSVANMGMRRLTSSIVRVCEKLRHHWRHSPIAMVVIFAVGVAASALAFDAVEMFRRDLIMGAFLIALVGLCGILIRNSFRRKLAKLEQRLAGIYEAQLKGRNAKLAKLEAELLNSQGAQINDLWKQLLVQQETKIGDLEERLTDRHDAELIALQEHLLSTQRSQIKDLVERLENRYETYVSELRALIQHDEQIKVLTDRIAKQEANLGSMKSQVGVVDLVAALRIIGSLNSTQSATARLLGQPEIEHGHGLLMAVLVDEERARPGSLAGTSLVEIGTTRERMAGQASTEKLAIFTALLGMEFITVDVDPDNTKRAEQTLRYLNPGAKAVTARGENYLKLEDGQFDYVYLDAFDYDHGKHSQQRQDRYRELLHTSINDAACWKMHEACAQAISAKMRIGGIVVLDDTWTDEKGGYAGKGKLALPLLLENGFEIIAKTRMTIALRRNEIKKSTAMESVSSNA